jgi:hypothetical protein
MSSVSPQCRNGLALRSRFAHWSFAEQTIAPGRNSGEKSTVVRIHHEQHVEREELSRVWCFVNFLVLLSPFMFYAIAQRRYAAGADGDLLAL